MKKPPSNRTHTLLALFTSLEEAGDGREKLPLGEILHAIGARGFGPLLVVLALMLISPVGIVPGIPAICGFSLVLIGVHMIVGRRQLWLPGRLAHIKIGTGLLRGIAGHLRAILNRLHPILGQRRSALSASPLAVALIGCASVLSGLVIAFVGFIPGLPFALSWHLLAFGLGLSLRDGVLVAIGWILVLPEVALILWVLP